MNWRGWLGLEKRMVSTVQAGERPGTDPFLKIIQMQSGGLGSVSVEKALSVPAFGAGVSFLSRTLAALPLHAYRNAATGAERIKGGLATLVHEAPNAETTSFKFRQHFWQQVFTTGRGLAWIERSGANIVALWGMDPGKVEIKRTGDGRTIYIFDKVKEYPAADVIDVPFMLKPDGLGHYGPVTLGNGALAIALAQSEYSGNFFAGGGVPPLALVGPAPSTAEGFKRAQEQINKAIKQANDSNSNVFPIPLGHELKQVGFDPDKGQMTEARRFQIEEIARLLNLPPVFLQDLTHGTFSNTEQQDLHLVKHLVGQWAKALEQELNLKLFGQRNGGRYVEHNIDGLLRGDFQTRMAGLAQGIQNAILTPNEARALENRPAMPSGDDLLVQGATVPLGSQPIDTPQTGEGAMNDA